MTLWCPLRSRATLVPPPKPGEGAHFEAFDTQVRKVVNEARYIFDAYLPGFAAGYTFMLLDDYQETYR